MQTGLICVAINLEDLYCALIRSQGCILCSYTLAGLNSMLLLTSKIIVNTEQLLAGEINTEQQLAGEINTEQL